MDFDRSDSFNKQTLQEVAKKIPQLDVSSVETLLTFIKTSYKVHSLIEENLGFYGLSPGRIRVLLVMYVENDKYFTPSELADKVGITRATVTGLLDGLVRDGIVERRNHPNDRRMVMIRLTHDGVKLLNRVLPPHYLLIAQLMSGLNETERKSLVHLLEKIEQNLPDHAQTPVQEP
ncbi:MarR family winged helix-turn-helix transcriptional regulator [Brevibacillus fulvus]|uniref:DNA-binding MarR family transcriptional regulator n=1 Tax=Brevibacillus fulvus TaxID=1125967 RepID=A0A938XVX7_9BACL|nr:MarR family transcriptional regulator [Brevibacillus fulvus]MBM7588926.1 DNA-binding MarR family transcriptional regulator [Brevibacillus fulvus]